MLVIATRRRRMARRAALPLRWRSRRPRPLLWCLPPTAVHPTWTSASSKVLTPAMALLMMRSLRRRRRRRRRPHGCKLLLYLSSGVTRRVMRPSTTSVRSKLQVGVRSLRLLSLSLLARTRDHVRLTGSTLFVRAETALLKLLSAEGDGVASVLDDPLRYMRYDQDPLRGAHGAVARAHEGWTAAQAAAGAPCALHRRRPMATARLSLSEADLASMLFILRERPHGKGDTAPPVTVLDIGANKGVVGLKFLETFCTDSLASTIWPTLKAFGPEVLGWGNPRRQRDVLRLQEKRRFLTNETAQARFCPEVHFFEVAPGNAALLERVRALHHYPDLYRSLGEEDALDRAAS